MHRAARLVLGIGTIIGYIAFFFFLFGLLLFFAGIVGLASDGPEANPGPAFVLGIVIFYISIIFLALLSTGLMMGYSFHAAWNEAISPKARGWWTVGIWLGSLLVMPFYWFKHLMRDEEEPAIEQPLTPPMTRQNAITIGVLTLVPFILLALGFIFFILFFSISMVELDSPRATGASIAGSLALMAVAYIIFFGAVIVYSVLLYVYGYLNAANTRVQPTYRGVWSLGLLMMPYFAIPAYWFLEIWQPSKQQWLASGSVADEADEPTEPVAPSAAAADETTAPAAASTTTVLEKEANVSEAPTVIEPAPESTTAAEPAPETTLAAEPSTETTTGSSTETTTGPPGAPSSEWEPIQKPDAAPESGEAIPLPPASPPPSTEPENKPDQQNQPDQPPPSLDK